LGYEHPDALLEVLSAKQITEWEAFNRIQPIGSRRFDYYFAYLMTTLHNIAIGFSGDKHAKHFKFEDFVPDWAGIKEDTSEMSPEEIKQFWIAFAEEHNKKVLEEKSRTTKKPRK
jgi:hypothetical protein